MDWLHHFMHLKNPPEDLYNPLVLDEFDFGEKGFSKTYKVLPKFKDFHEVGVVFDESGFEAKHKYSGLLKIVFMCGNSIILRKQIDRFNRAWFLDNNMEKIKKLSFITFESSLCENYSEIDIKLTVERPDIVLSQKGRLYISVSAVP